MNSLIMVYGIMTIMLESNNVLTSEYNSMADPAAIVVSETARFTILTPGVIRLEWAADGIFEDNASLVFVNRRLPVPKFTTDIRDNWLLIKTEKLSLKYQINSGKFRDDNLQIEFYLDDTIKLWKPGMQNNGNLKGTARTLDGYDGSIYYRSGQEIDLGEGIISRQGWMLIDDSERPLFDRSGWPWVLIRSHKEQQDWYFFGYGYDYKTALKDFTRIAGKIALPPRFVFGIWWSRYWEYTDQELRELVQEFEHHNVPLDVLVIDMDWHVTTMAEWYTEGRKIKDQAGQSAGWTGFTWNKNYFPDPKDFLGWTKEKGLRVCLNLHPASGIQPHEEIYPAMARAMGIDPKTRKYIPFDIINKHFAENFLDIVLHPMEEEGIDFWWLDWQQWSTTSLQGVNPTFYLNYVFFSDMERGNIKRPLIFHRYGGLGNHRYQIGFSGDTIINWRSLDFQPYFTATASNVGFGFWSHDIGGHMRGESSPELYTRWVQFGVFSPVLRTHCTNDPRIERRIWAYPLENYQALREAFWLRNALFPYIYTAAREAYDTGVSLCRPMYYDHPRDEQAYQLKNQYMFGKDILVSPVTQPMTKDSLVIWHKVWLPGGEWVEWSTGTLLSGSKILNRAFAIDEIPVYVKAGAIIPMQPGMHRISEGHINPLILNIFPGLEGSTQVYDDEGDNNNFQQGAYTFTAIHFKTLAQSSIKIVIESIKGSYPGMPEARSYEVRLPLTFPPTKVIANGKVMVYDKKLSANSWTYNGDELSTQILIPEISVHQQVEIQIEFPDLEIKLLSGKKGQFKKLMKFAQALANNNWDKSKYSNDCVVRAAQTGLRISMNPQNALAEIKQFDVEWRKLILMIKAATFEKKELIPAFELLKTK